jgi:hypothetical protein
LFLPGGLYLASVKHRHQAYAPPNFVGSLARETSPAARTLSGWWEAFLAAAGAASAGGARLARDRQRKIGEKDVKIAILRGLIEEMGAALARRGPRSERTLLVASRGSSGSVA